MSKLPITLIYDPIMFKGGSKVATSDALNLCSNQTQYFVVVTADSEFWEKTEFYKKHQPRVYDLPLSKWLTLHHNGLLYWLEQLVAAFILMFFIARFRGVATLLGGSGPGIDMPLYLVQKMTGKHVVQWVHGNVGCSRSIGYCLINASAVFYLPSTKQSILKAMGCYTARTLRNEDVEAIADLYFHSENYFETINGIAKSRWPTPVQRSLPVAFWAASLLKWKGLETLIDAIKHANTVQPVPVNICYIKPRNTQLPVSNAPINLRHTQWYQDPRNLDEIRSQSNIFISTSRGEPFGLSILEALAAGMCVLLPSDNAYWDQKLTHNKNCIKYQPDDPHSLCNALLYAFNERDVMERCCNEAIKVAKEFKAEARYQSFARYLDCNETLVAQK
tara:strand:+ start:532 stop:1701 length:1170 start_codon:yes stop_codon:yes gene_type:complete